MPVRNTVLGKSLFHIYFHVLEILQTSQKSVRMLKVDPRMESYFLRNKQTFLFNLYFQQKNSLKVVNLPLTDEKLCLSLFFFYLGLLSRSFTNHRIAGEKGGHFFNSSLPIPPASQTLRH